jgi:carboxymethylenebutenolidase
MAEEDRMQSGVFAERMSYPSASGGVEAYVAHPSRQPPWPAVIVVQEVHGLTPHIEDLALRFADQGYLALAPNLYCHDTGFDAFNSEDLEQAMRLGREVDEAAFQQLPADRREGVRKAVVWRNTRSQATYLPDLLEAVDYLKGRRDVRADAIGAVGYCMGGGLVGRMATAGADLAAGVINYGHLPPLEEVPNVRGALQGHYGGKDEGITSHVPELAEAMKRHGKDYSYYVYEGAPHAFFNDTRPSYHPEAAKLTWERTLDFFARHLKKSPAGVP